MVEATRSNGNGNGNGSVFKQADVTWQEAYGSSQIGPFDYCPPLGFREYWYPCIEARYVGFKKPSLVTMLGDEVVLFRDKDGKVVALTDWCPHRGARFSFGICDFRGTITCPYHGYTFDGEGQCVAGLIDSPDSPVVPKMRAKKYPTQEWHGIVFIWMGQTDPVALEDDLPPPLLDPDYTSTRYMRKKMWEVNWTEPVLQGIDFHEGYLHRWAFKRDAAGSWWMNFKNLFSMQWLKGFFRKRSAGMQGNVRVVDERENAAGFLPTKAKIAIGGAYYPTLGEAWPAQDWWRVLKPKGGGGFNTPANVRGWKPIDGGNIVDASQGDAVGQYERTAANPVTGGGPKTPMGIMGQAKYVQLPCIIYFGTSQIQMRWNVPVDELHTRVWTFSPAITKKGFLGRLRQDFWYYATKKPGTIVGTNEQEDLTVFMTGRLNLTAPQKLGPLDTGVIYFRRHLARRARDWQRLASVPGTWREARGPVEEAQTAQPEQMAPIE